MIIAESCDYCANKLRCRYRNDFNELKKELERTYYNTADGTIEKVSDTLAKIKIECPEFVM